MDAVFQSIASQPVPVVAIIGGCSVGAAAVIGGLIVSAVRTSKIEASRREIAAYLAEGSISAEDADTLLRGLPKHRD